MRATCSMLAPFPSFLFCEFWQAWACLKLMKDHFGLFSRLPKVPLYSSSSRRFHFHFELRRYVVMGLNLMMHKNVLLVGITVGQGTVTPLKAGHSLGTCCIPQDTCQNWWTVSPRTTRADVKMCAKTMDYYVSNAIFIVYAMILCTLHLNMELSGDSSF